MPTLHLLRHAKSSHDHPGADHDRPLTPRGERAARLVGEHLRAGGAAPDVVLCSSARRTRATLEILEPALAPGAERLVEDGLYLAAATDILDRLRELPATAREVLVVGHNPGLHDLALMLVHGHGPLVERLRQGFPTCALATLAPRHGAWRDLRPGGADLVTFVVPRDLG